MTVFRRLTIFFLVVGMIGPGFDARAQNASNLASLRERYLALHRLLIGKVGPPEVRAKIATAAQATRRYLARCGQHCDPRFIENDIQMRFPGLRKQEFDVVKVLVMNEVAIEDEGIPASHMYTVLQDTQQALTSIETILKQRYDDAMRMIGCLDCS